jgi:hypothetical protein
VLACELISRPYVNMGVADDWPYILSANLLAKTGHIVYNGWAAPILGWQLYVGAAMIKLFGFSFTSVRMGTLLVAMVMAFLLQRILGQANISDRNATLGTLALVLSPLYLMLSVTYMTDIYGLFAILVCLYGCLRALKASSSRSTIGWLCFAVATNAVCGTSRQLGWLGVLVMVPSTLWLLRSRRSAFLAGAIANLAGVAFVLACIHWFGKQPYTLPEHLLVPSLPLAHSLAAICYFFMDFPFLLLPLAALFLPEIRNSRPRVIAIVCAFSLVYILLAIHWRQTHPNLLLEPTMLDWVNVHGIFEGNSLQGTPPIFLSFGVRVVFTIVALGGILGLVTSLLGTRPTPPPAAVSSAISWYQLGVLLAPFTIAYTLLLIPRAAVSVIYDRYTLGLLVVAMLCITRYYQDRINPRLPLAGFALVTIMAIYGVAATHNLFALYRARAAMAAELRAAGIPDTSVDNGWEYNIGVELQHADHINEDTIVVPRGAYVPSPPLPAGICPMHGSDYTPHVIPLYGVSFDPNQCYGPAPFAPVTYSRWLASSPGTLYVVRYVQ